ncbi:MULTISPECIES: AAA family ATPase [unclassified Rhizobium]|uniref:AAA family ATPase n=1 Tax=unclassified Rhizobium TaxID=2613769 RepID=UPI001AD96F58|nr:MULTISPECIES: AAA family ATPase [unclassified Rhizobium]MBO9102350.1 AAA family ATPase [Rhizobium sp. L58/93]MBO9172392.1 AAA family ATPase [Rhizobium sp. L245/93]MBO9188185.1 AAA family ATPase [Rhizobium sp. E27B/91]QXZ87520.1 AAA family ATPase [Rhizobium sp. K1/93]QXZ93560.1 AAA family ATPase [Rhizobium sp. K15/93]
MFLKKITEIKNVGRFKSARIGGGSYEEFTLIYGGNGRGKTTLCAVLRSLQLNDPRLVTRRKTFKATSNPEIGLLLDSGLVRFSNGAWTAPRPDIHIFDQQFVTENVHGGDQIDVEHRRNFYRIVVGPTGVALAEEVDRLDADATAKQGEIANEKKVLEQHVPKGMKLEAFLKLVADAAVAAKIEDAKRTLKAINDSDAIKSRKLLSVSALPALPEGFAALLLKGVDGIAADAAGRVKSHIAAHGFHEGGESWLAEGLKHAVGDNCPFCATALSNNELVAAYRGYFSEAYADHKKAIAGMDKALSSGLSDAAALKCEQAFKDVETDAAFWKGYCDHEYHAPEAGTRIVAEVKTLLRTAKALLEQKMDSPLEPVATSADFIEASAKWSSTVAELDATSAGFAAANQLIQAVKDGSAAANKAAVEATLAGLEAVQKRHAEPVLTLATGYQKLLDEKKALVDNKDAKKKALDAYDEEILGAYEADINKILATFGAGFRLAQCGKNYVEKVPQSTYCLRFDTNDVDVTRNGANDPGFDTTMSAGDKNTFALAFFLAQLKRDPDLSRKLVVFDDPFTSLDDFRRAMTAKEIVRTGGEAAQTIVLSHDKFFLEGVRGLIHGVPCATMQISGTFSGSSIEPWDIAWEVKEGYLQDHMLLQEFAEGRNDNAREMRTAMRPLLEKYIRYRFPNQIMDGKWLGDMLAIIRGDANHPLTSQYNDLDDINQYTAPFHHDPNVAFVDDEVRTYAQRTIAIVGGC